jgi:Tol biopolymer transport system component
MTNPAPSFVRFPTRNEAIAIACAFLPFVVSMRSVSYSTVNGQITAFSYFDPLAIILGAVAIILTFNNSRLLRQTHPDTKLPRLIAIIIVLLFGAFHVARGFGLFVDQQAFVSNGSRVVLTPTPTQVAAAPIQPPQTEQILFLAKDTASDRAMLSIMNADGGNVVNLIPDWASFTGNRGSVRMAALSPDGRRIAYKNFKAGSEGIWIASINGSRPRQLTEDAEDEVPMWSPDGSQIAFVRESSSPETIMVISVDGGEPTPLITAADRLSFLRVKWSPDGKQIAYNGERNTSEGVQRGIWMYDLETSTETAVIQYLDVGRVTALDWSPDGTQLAFILETFDTDTRELWTVNADGSNPVNLTPGTVWTYDPAWSPDGKQIAFILAEKVEGSQDFAYSVYVMEADGDNLTRIADAFNGSNSGTYWQ